MRKKLWLIGLEILLRAMGNIILSKIEHIDPNIRSGILEKVDAIIRNDDDIEKSLDLVDQEVLVNLLKIELDICKRFRMIWKSAEVKIKSRIKQVIN